MDGPSDDQIRAARADVEAAVRLAGETVDEEWNVSSGRRTTVLHGLVGVHLAVVDPGVGTARRLLVTTGLVDELPDIPGVRERWGHEVIHCPYCHGWVVRDKRVGVLATTWFAVQKALLVRQWVDDLTLLLHTQPEPDDTQLEQLAARDVRVVRGEVVAFDDAGAHVATMAQELLLRVRRPTS